MNDVWRNANFVPHWGTFLIAMAFSLFIGGSMFLGWQQSTVLVSNVTCRITGTYPGSKIIHASLNCDGHELVIESPTSLVYDIVNKHVTVITCEALYEDDSLQGCKYTGIDVGR